MPVRIRIAPHFWKRPIARVVLLTLAGLALMGMASLAYLWHHFSRVIDARLSGEIFERASHVYAAPDLLSLGEEITPQEIAAQLRRFGYSDPDEAPSEFGRFRTAQHSLEVRPGTRSRVGSAEAVRVEFADGRITRIVSLHDGRERDSAWIDPLHLTNLFDRRRTKRRLVRYEDMPPELIQAVLAAEDRRFFDHFGISIQDGLRALWYDMGIWLGTRKGVRVHGASTLTMQLARSFFLNRDVSLKRKLAEALIALQLERRFPKEKILELYANEIYLGQRGSFSIHGLGEGAQAYFDKDISQLSLSEAAFLAGIIRGPNRYNPYRHPERAVQRRNHILNGMVETGALAAQQAKQARQEPLAPAAANVEASEAPYFVDLVMDQLLEHYTEQELISQSYRVNITLDRRLQQAAAEAIREALPEVDAKIAERYQHRREPPPQVQTALIVLDPHTGAVKALVGGRDYTRSQLNRAVADRQPGSAFKPFVFAAAFATALETPEQALTPMTTVVDEPTVFEFEGQAYEPSNYGEKFFGIVTAREALIRSLNVATVKVAELTGFDKVASLAVAAGLNPRLKATPSVALGAYDSTPLEVAGAYTVFANHGDHVDPYLIAAVLDNEGETLEEKVVEPRPVLDPRVAYLVLDLLQDNINHGTGIGTRARGFTPPAAGKTGTSRDAWFIGFTSNLLAVVWVGFDDSSDLGLPGSAAALPIWTAFMKRAVALPAYRNTEDFIPPEGIVSIPLDPETLLVAVPDCPEVRMGRFIVGTEPRELCPKHRPSIFRRVTRTLSGAIGIRRRPKREAEEPAPPPKPGVNPAPPAEDEEVPRPRPLTPQRKPGESMLNRAAGALRSRGGPKAKDAHTRVRARTGSASSAKE
ncbi:MAG: PBP1A family penicillin-binding protein [Terriglobia bacterium]